MAKDYDNTPAPRQGIVEFKNDTLIGRYDDFWSYIQDAEHPSLTQHAHSQRHHKHWMEDENSGWYGLPKSYAFAGVRDLVLEGWPDGLRRMDEALGSIEIPIPPISVRRKRLRSDFGDELDIHRVYSGDFAKAFGSMKRPPGTKRRSLQIVVDSIANGGRDADEMFWQGAGAIKLAELLSNAGYTVELYSAFKANANCKIDLRVLTKSSGAPLDLCAAAATLALPAFFRCIGHAWIHANLEVEHHSAGVGVESLGSKDGDFVADQRIDSKEKAIEWIQKQILRMDRYAQGITEDKPAKKKKNRHDEENNEEMQDDIPF
jgi:hypothetical protein